MFAIVQATKKFPTKSVLQKKFFCFAKIAKKSVGNPAEQCADPPIWRETPPGDIQGTVECGNLPDSPPYPIGHECNYTCPAGKTMSNSNISIKT